MQELWRAPVRRRLVRLCAAISGDPAAAEDLAQETLLEAWRNAHKLRDPSGAERWLAAIARNVCLRERPAPRPRAVVAAGRGGGRRSGLDAELERAELLELLDRALALAPAARRGTRSCSATSTTRRTARSPRGWASRRTRCRCASPRGKSVLRRMLAAELRPRRRTSTGVRRACGAASAAGASSRCATRARTTRSTFSCPDCSPGVPGSDFPLGNPHFAELVGGLVRPSAILARTGDWLQRYFGGGAGASGVCTRCGCARQGGAVPARGEQEPRWAVRRLRRMRRAGVVVGRGSRARPQRRSGASGASTRGRGCCRGATSTSAACRPSRFAPRTSSVAAPSTSCSRARRYACSASPAKRPRDAEVLLRRDFALLWTGGLVSIAGDWVLNAALPFFVYERTGSTIATAGMIVAELAPGVVIGSIAGVFVDRWDRKHVLVVVERPAGRNGRGAAARDAAGAPVGRLRRGGRAVGVASFSMPAEGALLPDARPRRRSSSPRTR